MYVWIACSPSHGQAGWYVPHRQTDTSGKQSQRLSNRICALSMRWRWILHWPVVMVRFAIVFFFICRRWQQRKQRITKSNWIVYAWIIYADKFPPFDVIKSIGMRWWMRFNLSCTQKDKPCKLQLFFIFFVRLARSTRLFSYRMKRFGIHWIPNIHCVIEHKIKWLFSLFKSNGCLSF